MSRYQEFDPRWLEWEDDRLGVTENAVFPDHINKENYQPRTLVDQTLETVDPIPNIHTLFVQFNVKFFRNVLLPVEVKWSPRMTSCAGVCTFRSGNRQCVISLSAPLLKLRPRKDLVETLLHEMIHAYLFLTNNNRDRDGHGPEFCKHMHRINAEAGTNITIYHTFHDEVRLYQQHWWKCNGPCRTRGPYFGTVRRAMNRAPGPSDNWYEEHRRTCGGTFIKIREPEKKNVKTSKQAKKPDGNKTLDTWLSPPREQKPVANRNDKSKAPPDFVKLGNATNNVHGFGTGGPGSSRERTDKSLGSTKLGNNTNNVRGWGTGGPGGSTAEVSPTTPSQTKYSISGVVGGSRSAGKSCLLDRFLTPPRTTTRPTDLEPPAKRLRLDAPRNLQVCPVCQNRFTEESMNAHLDDCLASGDAAAGVDQLEAGNPETIECPICLTCVSIAGLEDHVNACISERADGAGDPGGGRLPPRADPVDALVQVVDLSNPTRRDSFRSSEVPSPRRKEENHKCLICGALIPPNVSLEEHLENCVKIHYGDDSDDESILVRPKKPRPKEYPCPKCMEMYPEEVMNDHLDLCM